MSNVSSWNDKIVYSDDGFGYRITEGDEGEIVIFYFQKDATGKTEKEEMRIYVSELGSAFLLALNEKYSEMQK